jgi:hypothetical protein
LRSSSIVGPKPLPTRADLEEAPIKTLNIAVYAEELAKAVSCDGSVSVPRDHACMLGTMAQMLLSDLREMTKRVSWDVCCGAGYAIRRLIAR